MFTELLEFAKSQPFLIGGVGTVLTSSILYLLRAVPKNLHTGIKNGFTSSITIDNKSEYYNYVNALVGKCRLPWTFRNFEPLENDTGRENLKPESLIPGYGEGWGRWQGILFKFSKTRNDTERSVIKILNIKFFSKDEGKIKKFFQEAIALATHSVYAQKNYVALDFYWQKSPNKILRSLDTIFIDKNIKNDIIQRFDFFLNNEEYYNVRGIPYKFCMMFYGIPGTGRTSLIHALASKYNLVIYYMDSVKQIKNLFICSNLRNGIVVIEDVDCLLSNADREESDSDKDSVDNLHKILNALDGFVAQHGLIVALTTNYKEKLDPALIRPGRMDLLIELLPLDLATAKDMYFTFYENNAEAVFYWDKIKEVYKPKTGAELQQIFAGNSPAKAFVLLEDSTLNV